MNEKSPMFADLSKYFSGRLVLILLGLVSFPLMTRLLSVSEYGIVSLTLRFVLLLSVLSKCGLQYSSARFYQHDAKDIHFEGRQRFYSTLVFGPLLVSAMIVGFYIPLLFAYKRHIADVFLFRCLLLAGALIIFRSMQSILLSLLRNEGRSGLHSVFEILTRVLTLAAFVALAFSGLRSAVYILGGTAIAEGLVVGLQMLLLARRHLLLPKLVDWSLLRSSLAFGAPLILYELASIVLDSGDRILIRRFLGDAQLGLYSAAYNLSSYLQDSLMTPINLTIVPIYMRLWKQDGVGATQHFLSQALSWFLVATCLICGLTLLCAQEVVVLIASARFSLAARLLPVLVPGLMLYATHIFLNVGLVLQKRTGLMATLVCASAVVNLALNLLLIPRYGLMGGAWATLLASFLLVVLLGCFSYRTLPLHVNFSLVARSLVAGAIAFVIASRVHTVSPLLSLIIRIPLDLALFGVVLVLPSTSLRELVRTQFRSLRKGWSRSNPTHGTLPVPGQ